MSFDNCSLYLCPKQPDFTPENNFSLIADLQHIKFIANRIDSSKTDDAYYTGESFLDYIAYMGCAPAIKFEASNDNSRFCFISIHHYPSAMLMVSKKQRRAPHCPGCNNAVKNWSETKTSSTIHCQYCNSTSNIGDFNWRKMGGYAQLFIEISDIFPKEAIPQQPFLDKLAKITGVDWIYFYSCQ